MQSALKETKRRWQLELRVHPTDHAFVERLCAERPDTLSAFSDVVSDAAVPVGGLMISNDAGLTDVSLTTQVSELERFVAHCLKEAAP